MTKWRVTTQSGPGLKSGSEPANQRTIHLGDAGTISVPERGVMRFKRQGVIASTAKDVVRTKL